MLLALAVIPTLLPAQVDTVWTRRYDGSGHTSDNGAGVAVDDSANVFVAASVYNTGTGWDAGVLKYGPDGTLKWAAFYDDSLHGSDQARALALDSRGNTYVAVAGFGGHTYTDFVVVKFDRAGNLRWTRRYTNAGDSTLDAPVDIVADRAGGIYVTGQSISGTSNPDWATVKYDTAGNRIWVDRYDNGLQDWPTAIAVDSSGNPVVTGTSVVSGSYDCYTIKYYSAGGRIWTRNYNYMGLSDQGNDVACDRSGNTYVAGYSVVNTSSYTNYLTIKYDASGNQSWVQLYTYAGFTNQAFAIAADPSGNATVTGVGVISGVNDPVLATVRYSTAGAQLWARAYNGPYTNGDDRGRAVTCDGSGNSYLLARSQNAAGNTDFVTIKYNANGDTLWQRRYNGPDNSAEEPSAVAADAAGQAYVTGSSYSTANGADVMTIKYGLRQDVGCTRIVAPAGTIDSGTAVTPACSVYNYGQAAATYYTRMRIGGSYAASALVSGHAPGTRVYVTFPAWTALLRGSIAVTCSTELLGDVAPVNDRQTGSVTVNAHDVGATAIKAPTGTIDSGTALAPACSLYNYGNASESYSVRMRIGAGYDNTASVSGHPAGAYVYVTFPTWTALVRGTIATSCSTQLAVDGIRANDKAVGSVWVNAHDVGATAIKVPTGILDSGTAVTPACSLYNYGTAAESYAVRLKIGAGYNQTVQISGHAAGTRIYQTFPTWTAGPRGANAMSCSTELTTDQNRPNDKATGSVFVNVRDVGATVIKSPTGLILAGTVVTPACSVYNYGNVAEGPYDVRMKIGSVYDQTATVNPHPVGTYAYVTFPNWTAVVGTHATSCSTKLGLDMNYSNDKATGSVTVQALTHDVSCTKIIAPNAAFDGMIDSGTVVTPACSVANVGNQIETFTVRFKIGSAYDQTATVTSLAPGALAYVTFGNWTALPRGSLAVSCSTELTGDATPANDKQSGSVTVNVHDIGAVLIVAPTGSISPGPIAPRARVHNYGTRPEDCDVTFLIPTGSYAETYILSLIPSQDTLLVFPDWIATPGNYTARCSTFANDQVPANNVISSNFTCAVQETGWVRLTDLLPGGKGKKVKDGGCLAPYKGTDTSYIYGLKGNGRCEFYRFNAADNAWVAKESIPAIGTSGKKKAVKKGACMAPTLIELDGAEPADDIYAAKGNGTLEWWKYDPALSGTPTYPWTQKLDVPAGAKACKEGCGAATVMIGDTSFIFFLKGSGTQEFYRYNATTNTWATMTNAPTGTSGKPFKNGSALCASEDGSKVFCIKGSYNELFVYDVATNAWTSKTSLPLTGSSGKKKKVKDGAGIAYHAGYVYGIKGGGTSEFWTYQADSDKWIQGPDVPTGSGKPVKGGGALTYSEGSNSLYAFKGNNTLDFFKYGLSAYGLQLTANGENEMSSGRQPSAVSRLLISPNPFSGTATIRYTLPQAGSYSLKLYDITGQLVTILAEGFRSAGTSSLRLSPSSFASGLYILKLETPAGSVTQKLIVE
jgi:hypothetical protein